jgi:hypothetical protein
MIPQVAGPTIVPDEAALVSAINTLATAVGWTVVSAGTTPANSVWFQSPGEDGLHNIVGGLLPNTTTRQVSGFTASDLDTFGIVGPSVGGYTNNDVAGVATPVQSQTDTAASDWAVRDIVSGYRYIAAINLNAIAVLVTYESAGNSAQGFIYIGTTEPSGARLLQTQAKARIVAVGPGSIGAQRLVTLDRDITLPLKDGTLYPADPYVQALQFQCVAAGLPDAPDFPMLERIPIVAGSLSPPGVPTSFEIDVTIGVKLAAVGGRYDLLRGAGDLVRLMTEPNTTWVGASAVGGVVFRGGWNNSIAAWDSYCGQGPKLDIVGYNEQSYDIQEHNPCEISGRSAYYPIYGVQYDNQTALVPQPDSEGLKNVGALFHSIIVPEQNQPDLAFFRLAGDPARRYRTQEYLGGASEGLATPIGIAQQGCWAIGGGW